MDAKIKKVSVFQRDWLRYLATSGQPSLINDKNLLAAEVRTKQEILQVENIYQGIRARILKDHETRIQEC